MLHGVRLDGGWLSMRRIAKSARELRRYRIGEVGTGPFATVQARAGEGGYHARARRSSHASRSTFPVARRASPMRHRRPARVGAFCGSSCPSAPANPRSSWAGSMFIDASRSFAGPASWNGAPDGREALGGLVQSLRCGVLPPDRGADARGRRAQAHGRASCRRAGGDGARRGGLVRCRRPQAHVLQHLRPAPGVCRKFAMGSAYCRSERAAYREMQAQAIPLTLIEDGRR